MRQARACRPKVLPVIVLVCKVRVGGCVFVSQASGGLEQRKKKKKRSLNSGERGKRIVVLFFQCVLALSLCVFSSVGASCLTMSVALGASPALCSFLCHIYLERYSPIISFVFVLFLPCLLP